MASISIPGAQGGSHLTFSITGNAAANLANDFAKAVIGAPTDVLTPGSTPSSVAGVLNLISTAGQYELTGGKQYTYSAKGGSNQVGFFAGNNVFDGGTASGNTVTGGAGNDTINAGTGSTTVFSGSGDGVINLSDASGSGDVVVLQAGNSTVNASGAADTIFASSGAEINGGSSALVFVSTSDPSSGSVPAAVSVVSGAGGAYLFGVDGTDIALQGASSAGLSVFVAGVGNESLNAANAAGSFAFFGNTDTVDSSSISDTIVGGSGKSFFMTGTGAESLQSGSGVSLFDIASVAGGSVSISGFTSSDFVTFQGLSATQADSLVSSGTVSGGNLTVSLSDGTTIEFVGVTSLSGHVL